MSESLTPQDVNDMYDSNDYISRSLRKINNELNSRIKNNDYKSVESIIKWVFEYPKDNVHIRCIITDVDNLRRIFKPRPHGKFTNMRLLGMLIKYMKIPEGLCVITNTCCGDFVHMIVTHCLKEIRQKYNVAKYVLEQSARCNIWYYFKKLIISCPMLAEGKLNHLVKIIIGEPCKYSECECLNGHREPYNKQQCMEVLSWVFSLEKEYGKIRINSPFIERYNSSQSLIDYAIMKSNLRVIKYFMSLNTKDNPNRCIINSYKSWFKSEGSLKVLNYIAKYIPKNRFSIRKCIKSMSNRFGCYYYYGILYFVYENFVNTIEDLKILASAKSNSPQEISSKTHTFPIELLKKALERWPIEDVFNACPKYPHIVKYLFENDEHNKLYQYAINIHSVMDINWPIYYLHDYEPGSIYDIYMLVYYKYGYLDKIDMYLNYSKMKDFYILEPPAIEICPSLICFQRIYYYNSKEYEKIRKLHNQQTVKNFMYHILRQHTPKSEYYHLMPQYLKETNWKETLAIMIREHYIDKF